MSFSKFSPLQNDISAALRYNPSEEEIAAGTLGTPSGGAIAQPNSSPISGLSARALGTREQAHDLAMPGLRYWHSISSISRFEAASCTSRNLVDIAVAAPSIGAQHS